MDCSPLPLLGWLSVAALAGPTAAGWASGCAWVCGSRTSQSGLPESANGGRRSWASSAGSYPRRGEQRRAWPLPGCGARARGSPAVQAIRSPSNGSCASRAGPSTHRGSRRKKPHRGAPPTTTTSCCSGVIQWCESILSHVKGWAACLHRTRRAATCPGSPPDGRRELR